MKLLIVLLMVTTIYCADPTCDFFQLMEVGRSYRIGIRASWSNIHCRYAAEAPPGYKIQLSCNFLYLLPARNCQQSRNNLRISKRGRIDMLDADAYCGLVGIFTSTSESIRSVVEFKSSAMSGAKFSCTLTTVVDQCTCGKKNVGRIVGGVVTEVNEFPMMAAIREGTEVICGGTIISPQAILTAAHCVFDKTRARKVIVGEHDLTTAGESSYTKEFGINRVIIHENYNPDNGDDNDIAIIVIDSIITFNFGVSPSCLPFRYRHHKFGGEQVTALGWGALEFAGPRSNSLRKVDLQIQKDSTVCSAKKICTLTSGRDTCQNDSGGPILFAENELLYNIAVISNGVYCGINPSSNTNVSAYLDWIQSKTMPNVYCVK